MRRALIASLLLHATALGAMLVGLPDLGERLPVEEPITVDIVSELPETKPAPLPPKAPLAEAAPLPQKQAATPAPPPPPPPAPEPPKPPKKKVAEAPPPPPPPVERKPEPPPKPEPAPSPEPKKAEPPPPPKPEPEVKKAEPAPPRPPAPKPALKPTPPEPPKPASPEKQLEVAKEEPKKPQPPKPPTPEKAQADFDALLASVEAQAKRVKEPEKRQAKGVSTERGGTNSPGDAQQAQANPSALIAAISQQVTPCWNIPLAAQGAGGLKAEVQIILGPDGSARSVEAVDTARMASDPVFRTFAESAVRAVRACAPLKLPPEQYQVWRNVIINFDPSLLTG